MNKSLLQNIIYIIRYLFWLVIGEVGQDSYRTWIYKLHSLLQEGKYITIFLLCIRFCIFLNTIVFPIRFTFISFYLFTVHLESTFTVQVSCVGFMRARHVYQTTDWILHYFPRTMVRLCLIYYHGWVPNRQFMSHFIIWLVQIKINILCHKRWHPVATQLPPSCRYLSQGTSLF